jgi:hypothetical protein
VEGEKGVGRGAARGEVVRREAGAARGRSRTRHERLHPLLPLPPRRRAATLLFFLLAAEPHHHSTPMPALRPVATEVRTTSPLPMWMPRPSGRGGNALLPRAAAGEAGLHARLGLFVAGAAAFVDTRRSLGLAIPCRRCPPCAPSRSRSRSRSCSHSRLRSCASPRRPDAPRRRAPQHAHVSIPGARLSLGPSPLS